MSLFDLRPEALADTVDPAAAETELRKLRSLGETQQTSLAYALGYWVVQAIERPTDRESTLLLDRVCASAARLSGEGPQASDFRVRLRALRDLLENKRQAIVARESGQRPLQADAILEVLNAGPMSQSALGKKLQLTPGRISQLLAVMEERGLVERIRRGRENRVELPASAAPAIPRPTPPSTAAQGQRPIQMIFGTTDKIAA